MIKTVFSLAIVAALVGCAGGTQQTNERRSITYSSGMKIARPVAGAETPAEVQSVVISGLEQGARLGTVYFDFDQYIVKPQYLGLLQDLSTKLVNNPGLKMTLEGHTDEDGSREYNVALGQRRSEAVRQILVRLGVPASQLEAVSFGEEKPAVEGNTPSAKSQNRRAEMRVKH